MDQLTKMAWREHIDVNVSRFQSVSRKLRSMSRTLLCVGLLLLRACPVASRKTDCPTVRQTMFENEAVVRHVLKDYEKLSPPVAAGESVEVHMRAGLISIDGLEEHAEQFSFTAWMTFTWRDPRLTWSLGATSDPANASDSHSINSTNTTDNSSSGGGGKLASKVQQSMFLSETNNSGSERSDPNTSGGCGCQSNDEVTSPLFRHVSKVILPRKKVWTPNVLVSNSVTGFESLSESQFEGQVVVDLNGSVTWIIGDRFDVQCHVNTNKFPFDEQVCFAEFTTDTVLFKHTVFKLDNTSVNISGFRPNAQFVLLRADLAEGDFIGSWPGVRLQMVLSRRWLQYVLEGLLSIFLISFLNTAVFLLPPECGERMSFSVTLLLSYIVFMSSISSTLPPNSLTVCLYSVYLAALMLLSTLCAFVNVAIIAAYHSHTPASPVSGEKVPWEGKEQSGGCTKEGSQASYGVSMASSDSIPLSSLPARRASFDSISLLPFQMTPSVGSSLKNMSIDGNLPSALRSARKVCSPPAETPPALGGSGNRQGPRLLCGKTLKTWNKLAFYFTFGATVLTHVFFAILLVL